MKWTRETQCYMWAHYFSEDGKWKAWDEAILVKSSRKRYNPITKQFENLQSYKHFWKLENLVTGETLPQEFKTLTSAKQFAETN